MSDPKFCIIHGLEKIGSIHVSNTNEGTHCCCLKNITRKWERSVIIMIYLSREESVKRLSLSNTQGARVKFDDFLLLLHTQSIQQIGNEVFNTAVSSVFIVMYLHNIEKGCELWESGEKEKREGGKHLKFDYVCLSVCPVCCGTCVSIYFFFRGVRKDSAKFSSPSSASNVARMGIELSCWYSVSALPIPSKFTTICLCKFGSSMLIASSLEQSGS